MENKLIQLLDKNLQSSGCKIKKKQIVMEIYSSKKTLVCPYCGSSTSRVHSTYQREIQDIPMQEKQTILLLDVRKMFCDNPECTRKTFAERFEFIAPKAKKTKRLINHILVTSTKLSSNSASTLLKTNNIKSCKSSICDLVKKNAIDCG